CEPRIHNAETVRHGDEHGGASETERRSRRAGGGNSDRDQANFRSSGLAPVAYQPLQHYRRQVTPTRNPSPSASATVESGRSRITSSSVSSIEATCDCATFATALTRLDASATIESTFARVFYASRVL